MRRRSYFGLATLAMLVPLAVGGLDAVGGHVGSKGAGQSLTIYTGNAALVRMEVERRLAPGIHTVRIDGLPTNIDPSSLIVLDEGITLLGAHSFRSYQDVATGPGASIDLDLEADRDVERLRLAFLTTGLSWSASYAMVVAPGDASARVEGYATLSNNSGTVYSDAELQLLAGTISGGVGGRFEADKMSALRAFEERARAPGLEGVAFADYHLYTIDTPLSLRSGESRRIRLVGASSVKTRKEYTFSHAVNYHRPSPEPLTQPVLTSYRIERREGTDFGSTPLPAGQIRVLQPDEEGRIQLLGVASLPNTPAAEDLRVTTGYAFDIVGTRTQTDYKRPGGNVYESAWSVSLRNRSDADVTVQVMEQLTGEWRIVESSHRAEKLSAGAARFEVEIPAGSESTLEYRVSVKI